MKTVEFREALREAMSEEMRRDESVFLLGEEVAEYNGAYKVSKGMLAEFGPKRIIDTPIAELGFAGIAVGAASNGLRPIVEFMTFNFSLVAIDQVSLKVIVPSNPYDAKGLLKSAIRDNDPVIFMESEQMYGDKGEIPEGEYIIPIGVADIKKQGTDVTLATFGKITKVALKAAEELAKEGINCEVVDLRTVRPIDYKTIIESVKKTNRLVVVEEAWPLASISSEIAYMVQKEAFDYLDAPIRRVTTADVPLPYAPTLIEASLPNVPKVVKAVKEVMYKI